MRATLINTTTKHTRAYSGGPLDVDANQHYEFRDFNGPLVKFMIGPVVDEHSTYTSMSKIGDYYFMYKHTPHYMYDFMYNEDKNMMVFSGDRNTEIVRLRLAVK